jgi:hypothetical protein
MQRREWSVDLVVLVSASTRLARGGVSRAVRSRIWSVLGVTLGHGMLALELLCRLRFATSDARWV